MFINIHCAVPEQTEALSYIALSAKRHWGYPERWMELWTPQLTFSLEYFAENESWVALDGERPIGFHTLLHRNGNAWIENLWVLPQYMGKGVGRQLFLHALELSRQRGYKTLQLEADPNAMGFYEKMGMQKIREHVGVVDGQSRVLPIMEMTL